MNLDLLGQWMTPIQVHLKNLKKPQALGLALFSFGVMLARTSQRSKIAEELALLGKIPTVEKRLRRWLSNPRIVVQADRGIGCSSTLMKAIDQRGMHYLVRLQRSCVLTSRQGGRLRPSQLVAPGEAWTGRGRLFNNARRHLQAYVHVIWEVGQKEPWCLATNDAHIAGQRYALRVWQKESFHDLKSGGWQWHTSYLKSPERMERLVLVLALAYAWMLTHGTFVLNGDSDTWHEVVDGKQSKYSIFRLGLRFFKRMLYTQIHKIYVGLWLWFAHFTKTVPLPVA